MQIYDLNEYKSKGKPILPIVVGIVTAIIIVAILVASFLGGSSVKAAEATADGGSKSANESTTEGRTIKEYSDTIVVKEDIPATLSDVEISSLIDQANKAMQAGKYEAARDFYLTAYEGLGTSDLKKSKELEDKIGRCSIELFTTPRPMNGKVDYVIKHGDTLTGIASNYNCPVALIKKSNNIKNENSIRPGDRLIFPDHPKFSIRVSKTENTLTLFLDGRLFKKYIVGTGQYGKTPVGTFKIGERIENPDWWADNGVCIPFGDPNNILGTRWLKLVPTGDTIRVDSYGIHGTWDNSTLGQQSSNGCVRMSNKDVEELTMLVPLGTEVEIVE